MNLVLIGYRGSGKSTVGKSLAARLRMRFVDTDDLVEERLQLTIGEIVRLQGWDHFRQLEKKIIEEISKESRLVIASGGGAVIDRDNVESLRRNGLIIWLKADHQALARRMGQDPGTPRQRPTLTGKGTLEELEETMSVRESFYERASEIRIDTSRLDVESVVERILTLLAGKVNP
ncbi:MAG: hypothetical protein A2170_14590 [Deltaproteobacteria bacterium RBG_13_53_10]|nr:MAG: hypothetical protein A2170_14590 [Deltaproteobacteria bacterium RBG_13_53_10]